MYTSLLSHSLVIVLPGHGSFHYKHFVTEPVSLCELSAAPLDSLLASFVKFVWEDSRQLLSASREPSKAKCGNHLTGCLVGIDKG